MQTDTPQDLQSLQETAVAALRRYPDARDSAATDELRTVARSLVAAREHFFTRTGDTDWLGQTHAYRAWVREAIDAANLPRESISTVQNAVRYHVGNALRERLDSDTLTALGLRTIGPRERSVERRTGNAAILSLFQGGPRLTAEEPMCAAASAMLISLRRFDLTHLSRAEAKKVRDALAEVRDAADALLAPGSRMTR